MFTWTSNKAACLGLIMVLGGCEAALFPDAADLTNAQTATLSGRLKIKGPDGYCVDSGSATRQFGLRAVTLFSCARMKDAKAKDPTEGRMFTASVARTDIRDLEALADFLKTDDGKVILARDDDASDITVHRTKVTKSGTYIEYTDVATPKHLGQRTWRGFVNVDGQTAILSLYQGSGGPISGVVGESTIREFAAQVVRANADPG